MVTTKHYKPGKFARFVLYPLGAIAFFMLLTVVLILANGYRFTFNNNKVGLVKTGMLIVSSRPFLGGQIFLNNKATKDYSGFYLLPTKISDLTPGTFDVQIRKSGYRTWEDHLEITPNMVTWADYVLLFADKLNINKINVPTGSMIAQSLDGRHILFSDQTQTNFTLKSVDTNNLSVKDFWPQTGITDTWLTTPQILSAQYSINNDRLLLKIHNGDKVDSVVADNTGSQPKLVDLSTILGKNFTDAWCNPANNDQFYMLDGENVYLVNISDTSLGNPIADNVISLNVADNNQIYYVAKNSDGTYYLSKMNLDGSQKETLVDSIAPGASYKIGFSSQNSIVAVLNNTTGDLNTYYIGNAVKKYSIKMSGNVLGFDWSKDGQKLNYFGKNFVKRYDWENNKEVSDSLTDTTLSLDWYFDENHYLVVSDKGLYVIDFDGSNKVSISNAATINEILDQGNNNIIYSTKATDGQATFYRFVSEF
jgi:hypothetical protein